MKLLAKKTAPKKTVFTAINKAELKQVKGGVGIASTAGLMG